MSGISIDSALPRTLTKRVIYGTDDDRVRATWRVLAPLLVAVAVFMGGRLSIGLLQGTAVDPNTGGAVVVKLLIVGGILIFVTGSATVTGLFVASRLDQRSLSAYGFDWSRAWGRDFCAGVLIGLVASSSMMGVLVASGPATASVEVTGVGDGSLVAGGVVAVVLGGFLLANNVFEEVLFRVIVIRNAAEGLRSRSVGVVPAVGTAVAISLVLFGLFHLLSGGSLRVISSAVAGIYFAAGYVLTGRLSLPIGVHFGGLLTISMTQAEVFGEYTLPSVVVVEQVVEDSLLVTLGSQTVRMLVSIALIAAWVSVVYGDLSIEERVYTESK